MLRHYTNAMRNYAIFRGRASRAEFWSFYAVFIGMALVVVVLDQTYFGTNRESSGIISLLFACVHILPGMAVQVRRLHDIDWSGWAILINLVPFGTFVVLVLACLIGTGGPNRFGPGPGLSDDGKVRRPAAGQGRGPTSIGYDPAFADPSGPTGGDPALVGTPYSPIAPNRTASASQGAYQPNAGRDPIADIERLAKLRDSGSITDDEFQAMKAKALAELRN